MINRKIVVERITNKRLQPSAVIQQIQRCTTIALKGARGQGWTFSVPSRPSPPILDGETWVYKIAVSFSTTSARDSLERKWPEIVKRFAEAGTSGNLRASPWKVIEPEGFSGVAAEAKVEAVKSVKRKELAEAPKKLGEITLIETNQFNRVYNRRAQIGRITGALELADRTGFEKRTHSLLDGSPGSGKTEIMRAFAAMLGKENEAWLWFDAPSMTKAGAIELLMKAESVPPVIFIEEIEKSDSEFALKFLLGIMDTRGTIRRTNYRVGNEARNVRVLVIATANDVSLLKSMMSGALYSRFQNKIYCPPPDRQIMEQILKREISEINGDPRWIEPTLQFGVDKWGITDPRDVITILSCGGDRLLDGSYQRDYEETMHPLEKSELLAAKNKKPM